MKYRFLSVIHYLEIDKPECRIPLKSGIITNKSSLIDGILNYRSNLAVGTLGVHSIDEFKDTTYYLVDGEFDPIFTVDDVNRLGTQLAFVFLRQIQQVTSELWLVRDNSVYVRDGFLFVYDKMLEDGMTFKASLGTINSKASLVKEGVKFSKEEITKAASDMMVLPIEDLKGGDKDYSVADQFQYFKGAGVDRKYYAWIYISFARANAAIPVKILMYVTAMEALVSTTTLELSHQVSERVAILLGRDTSSRVAIYGEVKKAYGYRSKAAHGEALKGSEQEMVAFLTVIDGYLRQLMSLEEPYNLDEKHINDFFLEKLMSLGDGSLDKEE